jgi:hypothetical protein
MDAANTVARSRFLLLPYRHRAGALVLLQVHAAMASAAAVQPCKLEPKTQRQRTPNINHDPALLLLLH